MPAIPLPLSPPSSPAWFARRISLETEADKDFVLTYADWLAAHIEDWTVTTRGELVEGVPTHYIRINPADPDAPDPHADPNTTMIEIANGGGLHPARNVVGGDFLQLVRFGIRAANDPTVLSSVEVIDRVLRRRIAAGAVLAALQSRRLRPEGRRQRL